MLLVTSPRHPLQIWRMPLSDLPDDPHVKEAVPTPEEIFSLPLIRYDSDTQHSSLVGRPSKAPGEEEVVLEARLLPFGTVHGGGPHAALLCVRTITVIYPVLMTQDISTSASRAREVGYHRGSSRGASYWSGDQKD